ncbi:hypothetical protein LAZ67_7001413 [Cordylochernes scorpioides]|uniref:Reverse transcriptase/retrotransposon-derived protein RNase H-like domain-containing protein n=1 Tax=Cordylochernes scorpioides TaxID=51811 RepID=A0ABY6KMQ3_9ARAC|nr:hypothetical protein LAZ67_7001413 [Cordylochernes scorpioides]
MRNRHICERPRVYKEPRNGTKGCGNPITHPLPRLPSTFHIGFTTEPIKVDRMTEDGNMQRMTEAEDEYYADALTNMQPHCDELVSRLTDAIRGIAVPRVEETLISPLDGSHAANNFIQQLERTSEGPQDDATLQARLRTLLKVEALTEGLQASDQRLMRAIAPKTLTEWYSTMTRIKGTSSLPTPSEPFQGVSNTSAFHRDTGTPSRGRNYNPFSPNNYPRYPSGARRPPSPCKYCQGDHWNNECSMNRRPYRQQAYHGQPTAHYFPPEQNGAHNLPVPAPRSSRTPQGNENSSFQCQHSFDTLKECLTTKPVLHLFKEGLPCQLFCDASLQGIAGILKQQHPDGTLHPVQYYSRALRPHEKNYTITELECLAVIDSVEKFRIYLAGVRKVRRTDVFDRIHLSAPLDVLTGKLCAWQWRSLSHITNQWNEIVFTYESRFCLQHHDGRIRVWRHRGERMLNSCVMHRHTGPAPDIMVWGGIGYHSRIPLVRIAGALNSQRYISQVLEPVVLPYFRGLPTVIFQQIASSAATADQLWQRVEAAWSAVPQEHIQSFIESMPRRVAAVISNKGGYSGY